MRKIILYTAASLDDFIARNDGAIDWLENPAIIPEGEDFGYGQFYASVDTTLMGNNTFKQVIGFGGAFPYTDKKNYVVTRNPDQPDHKHARYITGDISDFCKKLKTSHGRNIWLIGGGELNTALLDKGLIDQLIITKIPIPLGSGIPIFQHNNWKSKFTNESTRMYEKGVIQVSYAYKK